ncbi:MAG TPA: hypothetical protein PK264_23930, partial [Hyphomicrobiaceae bacterium]|nr:hypothetical protein [Hyphomicrobiaceae bacterium]
EGLPAATTTALKPSTSRAGSVLDRLKKRLPTKLKMPTWLPDLAVRLAILKKQLENGKRVEEAVIIAEKALAEVARISAALDAGLRITEAELIAARARLETMAELIEGLAGRVGVIEARTSATERELALHMQRIARLVAIMTRPGCGTYMAFDRRTRRCRDMR